MPTKKLDEKELALDTYTLSTGSKLSIIGACGLLLFFGFFFHFPIETIIVNTIQKQLEKNKTCRVNHSGINIGWFRPKIIMNSPSISGICARKLGGVVKLDDLVITALRPTFSPMGIMLGAETKWMNHDFDVYVAASPSKQIIRVNEQKEVVINCTASLRAKTGVEMEALVGASLAALTIYDMCKAMSHDIIIKETKLIEKTGGKRDFFRKEEG